MVIGKFSTAHSSSLPVRRCNAHNLDGRSARRIGQLPEAQCKSRSVEKELCTSTPPRTPSASGSLAKAKDKDEVLQRATRQGVSLFVVMQMK